MSGFTHFDDSGKARMVDVSAKPETERVAIAGAAVRMAPETLAMIAEGSAAKGDVLGVARLAGIMAAKQTSGLIPLCHPLPLTSVEVELTCDEAAGGVAIRATARARSRRECPSREMSTPRSAASTITSSAMSQNVATMSGAATTRSSP